MLAHNVFFTLTDQSDAAKQALLGACKRYLVSHPGIRSFACGTLAEGLSRPVNVRDFDVSLHIIFDSQASHDAYQDSPPHHQFVEENRANWAHVRVFDSVVDGAPGA